MDNAEQRQFQRMTESPIDKLIVSLSIPTIISMLISAVYNMADTYFVSKLGTSASGAVGIVFALMAIIQAVGFMFGLGSGSLISRLLGKQQSKEAEIVGSSGLMAGILFGILLTVFGTTYIKPLMKLLGATDTILPYAQSYGFYILLGAPAMLASFVLNNLLRSEGKAKFAMIGISVGGILNCFLDPLFIFTFKLGIAGAAIATALSQIISFIILLSAYISGKTIIKLSIFKISKKGSTYLSIFKSGMPSLCRQGLASISTVALNVNATYYGDAAVAAMSIVGKVFMLILAIMIGFGQGYQPVVGYNYGARRYDRVKKAYFFILKVSVATMSALGLICFIFAPQIMKFFINDDINVITIGTKALRAQCSVMPLVPLGVLCNMTFQAVGKSFWATITSSLRQGILFFPLIMLLPKYFGITGVEITQSIADICTFIFVIPFTVMFIRQLGEDSK